MEGSAIVICALVLVAAVLVYLNKDRTSHALVLAKLDLYMANNLELKNKIKELEQSNQDQRTVYMAHTLQIKNLEDKCEMLSGRQSNLHKKIMGVEHQTRTTKVEFSVVSPEKPIIQKLKKQMKEMSQ